MQLPKSDNYILQLSEICAARHQSDGDRKSGARLQTTVAIIDNDGKSAMTTVSPSADPWL